jgi:penicillin-insensitive murein endopeptidase
VRIIGTENAGCIAGAVELPPRGPGYQTIRTSRSAYWGAPRTIAGLETLAAEVHAAGLPDLYMGDITRPRGGPMPGGHVSHQMGIDADVYLDLAPKPELTAVQREEIEPPSMVSADRRGVDPAHWGRAQITLIHFAAELPEVERIFVNPAIKRALCEQVSGDRAWLHTIRPWYGHASHMHIRWRCPADQTECTHVMAPIPAGDGCDASLQWWFDQLNAPPAPPKPPGPPAKPSALPAACRAVMEAPAAAAR